MTDTAPEAEVRARLAEVRSLVERARSMPLSTSAVIDRRAVLAALDRLEQASTGALDAQRSVLADRDAVINAAQEQASAIRAEAEQERRQLAGETEMVQVARREAEAERERAATETEALRRETDEYVDERLATLEVALTNTLRAVTRGRETLRGRSRFDALAEPDQDGAPSDAIGERPGGG